MKLIACLILVTLICLCECHSHKQKNTDEDVKKSPATYLRTGREYDF